MKKGVALSILILSSMAISVMLLTLGGIDDSINIKDKIVGKSVVSKVSSMAEKKTMESVGKKLENIEELIIVSMNDENPTNEEVLYEKYISEGNIEKKFISNKEPTEREKLIYKVSRRLRPENDIKNKVLKFGEFDKHEKIGYRANLWSIAEEVVNWSKIYGGEGRKENEESYTIGENSTDYQQEYPLEDYLIKSNLTKINGKIAIDGDFDNSINSYVADIVQIKDGKINLYKYSMLEDKFELEKNISVESPKWSDERPIVTTVFNKNTNLLETYIGVYSSSKKKLNLYVYSLIEDKIELIGEEWDLTSRVANENMGDSIGSLLEVDEEYISDRIKDVKISSDFNESINLPQIVIGVNSKFIGRKEEFGKYTYFTEDIVYNYEYIPVMDDFPTVSNLHIRDKIKNWDMEITWSDATKTNNLSTVINSEKDGLKYYSAMVIIDDKYEYSQDNSTFESVNINEDKINSKDIDDLVFTSFNDKTTRLTKNVLVVKVGSKLYQLNGSMELEEWEDMSEIDRGIAGELDITSIKGDISSIHLLVKPKIRNYYEIELPIEIVTENQKTKIRSISRTSYKVKVFDDNKIEYKPIERKRDYRNWRKEDSL